MCQWASGLCDYCTCSDGCFCLLSLFCTPIAYGYNTALMRGATHPHKIEHCGPPALPFMYLCAFLQYTATSPQYLGLLTMWVCLSQTFLVKNMLVAVRRERGKYTGELPECCCCFDTPCCLSFWCMPCTLTVVRHEAKENHVYAYDDARSVFKMAANSMFDMSRNV